MDRPGLQLRQFCPGPLLRMAQTPPKNAVTRYTSPRYEHISRDHPSQFLWRQYLTLR